MTSKFSIDNRELLQRISSGEAVVGIDFGNLIVRELAAFRLAAMDSEPVAWEFWPEDDYEQMFLVQGTDDPASETVDHAGKKWISSPLFRGNNTSAIKENQLRIQGIEALEKFLTASPTECSMSAGVLLALECSRILKVIIKNNGWGDFTGGKFEEGTSETIISDLIEPCPKASIAPYSNGGKP
ncbi:hypothetical protein [Klebsiella pneumoniae]|uniref:hypothetical protein n=1 Tax=Klebsiella pneumoniae TaxID=573 RepID=UPI002E7FF144|nr:hypothetical protein [Klebsiella pneumoniae]MEE2243521.1 hypothetical protein [Klebsiella pneumoniae]